MYKILFLLVLLASVYGQGTTERKPLALKDAIKLAIENNPSIRMSEARIQAARGKRLSGLSLPSPSLSFTYEEIPLGNGLRGFGERYIEVRQAFDLPLSYYLRGKFYSKEIETALSDLNHSKFDVEIQVRRAYINTLAAKERLKTAQENFSIAEDFYNKASVRKNIGEATSLELLTARLQRTHAENEKNTSQNKLLEAANVLSLSMGLDNTASSDYDYIDSIEYKPFQYSEKELTDIAIANNYKLKSAEFSKSSASINRSIARWSLLPNFEAAYSRQTISNDPDYYGVSLTMSVPLWFMFDHRGQMQEASANYSFAENELKLAVNEILTTVKNLYLQCLNNERELKLYTSDLLPQSEEVYRSARLSYETGEISYIEFLQARQTLSNARSGYIDALENYSLSLIAIEETIGKTIF